MKNIKKKFLAAALVFSFAIPAHAGVPVLLIHGLIMASGGYVPFAISTATIGSAIAFIKFSEPSKPESKPIHIQLDPNTPLITPEGWTDPSTPPATADPTSNTTPTYTYNGTHGSVAAACAAFIADQSSEYQNLGNVTTESLTTWGIGTRGGTCHYGLSSNPTALSYPIYTANASELACPDGYVASGATCTLDEPAEVQKPPKGVDEFKRDGNNLVRDPQQDPSDNSPTVSQPAPNRIEYTDQDTGEKVVIELGSGGEATLTHSVPNTSNNTTSKQTTTISAPSGGAPAITGKSTQTYTGTGSQVSPDPQENIDCPGCATEITLSNILALMQSTPDGDPNATGEGIAANLDALQQQTGDTNSAALQDWISNSGIKEFYEENILPLSPFTQLTEGTEADCEFHFTFMGTAQSISICEAQPALHTALSFIFFILMVLGILNIMTERPDGA